MRKMLCNRKWICSFFLLAFWSAGAGKTGYPTDHLLLGQTVQVRDTVPGVDVFDFYVSNLGSNTNSGQLSTSPQLSIDSIGKLINEYAASNNKASLGLQAGSKFREQFNIKSNNIRVSSFGLRAKGKIAQLTGMDVVTDWRATAGKSNVYEYPVSHSVELVSNYYNCLLVAEIDTAMEKLYPLSAMRYLTFVGTADLCESTPGSFYTPILNKNPIPVYIHATQGIPGKNKFRYEVVKRPYAINAFTASNCTYENLYLNTSGNGVGMLAGGENTLAKNIIFQGGGTHHAVIYSGAVEKSLFLPGPKGLPEEIGLVFYKPEGRGSRNTISNSLFLDIRNPIFTHTNGASNYRSLSIDSVYAFADTTNVGTMLSGVNADSIFISNTYCRGYRNFWVGLPSYLSIKNSIINRVSEPAVYLGGDQDLACNVVVSNTLIVTNSNDANQHQPPGYQPSVGFLFPKKATSLKVTNTIFHGHSTWHTQYATETVFENGLDNKLEAFNNIYICDVNPENYMHVVHATNTTGKGTASNLVSDYNVYIILRGTIYWTAHPSSPQGDGNIFTLQEWQAFSGQDQHSIVIDLRNNPAGLKAIFTDPENGNWKLAQTPQADSVRKINAGMLTPPLYYPIRPTYEDAADYTLPGGLSVFTATRDASRQVKLDWNTIREPNLAYFSIESSINNLNFTKIANIKTAGRYTDNAYSATYPDSSITRMYYRLRLVNTDSSYTFSSIAFVDPSKKDSVVNGIGSSSIGIIVYPNPAQASLTIEHPARDLAEISIFDITGRLLKKVQVAQRSLQTVVSLKNMPAGKYILRWTSEHEKKAVSFIKSGQ